MAARQANWTRHSQPTGIPPSDFGQLRAPALLSNSVLGGVCQLAFPFPAQPALQPISRTRFTTSPIMQLYGLLLCTLMTLSVLTAPNDRRASRQKRSLDNEIKESWMMHKRQAADAGAAGKTMDLSAIIGGTVTAMDLKNLLEEFLRSPVNGGPPPKSSLVGKAKATEMITKFEAAQKTQTAAPLSAKAASSLQKIAKSMPGLGVPLAADKARRSLPPAPAPAPAGPAGNASTTAAPTGAPGPSTTPVAPPPGGKLGRRAETAPPAGPPTNSTTTAAPAGAPVPATTPVTPPALPASTAAAPGALPASTTVAPKGPPGPPTTTVAPGPGATKPARRQDAPAAAPAGGKTMMDLLKTFVSTLPELAGGAAAPAAGKAAAPAAKKSK
ncbi:hypothetical protein KEM48_010096 [Puccinia striiformis f. sp. tritici PST-130]|nr:hypothetical protein KEM48_010096 [Puccinia striiformis f. sp. tritici PST-130]